MTLIFHRILPESVKNFYFQLTETDNTDGRFSRYETRQYETQYETKQEDTNQN